MTVLLTFGKHFDTETHLGIVVTVDHDTAECISAHTQGRIGEFQSRSCVVGNAVNGFGVALFRVIPFQLPDLRKADKAVAVIPVDFPIDLGRYVGIAAHDFGFKERVLALADCRIEPFYIIEIRSIEQFQRHFVRDCLAEIVFDNTAVNIIPMSGL